MSDHGDSDVAASQPYQRLSTSHMIVLFGVVVAGRLAFSLDRRIFHLVPDEPATLAMARWLSDGGQWDMFNNSTWRPGFATLLAPVFWATDDQDTIMKVGLIIGAMLGGAAAVITAHLVRRLTDLPDAGSIVVAGAVALTPAALSASAHVWAEPLVTATFLMTLWSLLRFYDNPTIGRALATIAWSIIGYTSHGRLLLLVLIAAVATIGRLITQRRWKATAGAAIFLASATSASAWYANTFVDALWTQAGDRNTVGAVMARFSRPVAVVESGIGQMWYLLVSTLGLAAIGAVVLVGRLTTPKEPSTRRRDALILLGVTTPMVMLSILFMSGRERSDHLIYGRYNEAIVWPIVAVGASWIFTHICVRWRQVDRSTTWLLLGTPVTLLITGALIELVHGDRLGASAGVVEMIPGLIPGLGSDDRVDVLWLTALAIGAFGLLVVTMVLDRQRGFIIVPVVAIWIGLSGFATHRTLSSSSNFGAGARAVREIDWEVISPDVVITVITYGLVPEGLDPGASAFTQSVYAHAYQWYLPERRFRVISTGDYPADALVFAPIRDPILLASSAEIIWNDPDVGIALWRTDHDLNTG